MIKENTLLINFEKKMLNFEFPKQFHTKHNNIIKKNC
jgi:hypothetical protein